jgi:hypothetical protein
VALTVIGTEVSTCAAQMFTAAWKDRRADRVNPM